MDFGEFVIVNSNNLQNFENHTTNKMSQQSLHWKSHELFINCSLYVSNCLPKAFISFREINLNGYYQRIIIYQR